MPCISFTIIRKRGLVTRRWPFSTSIRARSLLAIFHSSYHATVKSTFPNFFERRRRARIDAENGHRRVTRPHLRIIVKETQGIPTGYLRVQSGTVKYGRGPLKAQSLRSGSRADHETVWHTRPVLECWAASKLEQVKVLRKVRSVTVGDHRATTWDSPR